ncbi:putative Mitogen-activated protein kinase kinase kinase [Melia azedarach]|uniref:Mitogen-activated protein kinase kinase kinase n=1 Tax=Melia azedarach TaxID=155640 RepID=A0ACC1YA16_MELAZ|nr:putative Mitogen-activated protein kinase kinase kinase [Melia azedarach]
MDSHGVSWFRGPILGKGSFGSVFMATLKKPKFNTTLFPPVMAVKSAMVSSSASLQREKEILDDLRGCPFVLECFGEETTTRANGEMVYNLLIEYASGGTLGDIIDESKGCGLPEIAVRHYTRCILEGISHIHECGYVHCDLKPDNILLLPTEGGKFVVKIADLGLAKRSRQSKKQRVDCCMRGTPLYLAPETVVEHLQESPSDIWALGCVVLEMLTGRQAWDLNPNCSTQQLYVKIGSEKSIPEIPAWISEEGKDFLRKCFVRKPMFRFTAEMLLDNPFVHGVNEEIFRELKGEYCSSEENSSLSCGDYFYRSVGEVASGIQRRRRRSSVGSTVTVDEGKQ